MTNEQRVMENWNRNRFLGKSAVEFRVSNNYTGDYGNRLNLELKERIEALKKIDNIVDRVNKILLISRHYSTYIVGTSRFQCRPGARRSTVDIWRIYKNYFEEVDIFTIMRALYVLVNDRNLNTIRCSTVRKRVFWYDSYNNKDFYIRAELGVPLSEWKEIGLNQNEQT